MKTCQIINFYRSREAFFYLNAKKSSTSFLLTFRSQVAMKCINRMEKFLLRAVVVLNLMINFSLARRLGIVGGESTDILKVPYQAAYLAAGKLKCGASIISDNCAFTASNDNIKVIMFR